VEKEGPRRGERKREPQERGPERKESFEKAVDKKRATWRGKISQRNKSKDRYTPTADKGGLGKSCAASKKERGEDKGLLKTYIGGRDKTGGKGGRKILIMAARGERGLLKTPNRV